MHPSSPHLSSADFLEQVLALRPAIAVFDCDGTLWSGDSGAGFFEWEMEQGLVPAERIAPIRHRYDEYLAGRVDELSICGEMIQINAGVSEELLRRAARQYFAGAFAHRIFPVMRELCEGLGQQGCELWAVSSTNNWVVEAGSALFGIPASRVLAATLAVEDGLVSSRLLRVPTDELKQTAIEEVIGRRVDAVFGNSIHDFAMLEKARHPFAVNPTAELEARAVELGWPLFRPEAAKAGEALG